MLLPPEEGHFGIFSSCFVPLLTKVLLIKLIIFPVVMYGCKSWIVKKADAEELMLSKCGAGEDS